MKTSLVLRGAADLGPARAAAIVASTARSASRRRRDQRAGAGAAVTRSPGALLAAEPLTAEGRPGAVGLFCRFAEADLEVRFLADDVVRLTWGPGEPPVPWALVEPSSDHRPRSPVEVTTGAGARGWARAAAPDLSVSVSADGEVSFFGPGDVLVRREPPPLRRGASRTARFLLRPGERVSGLGEQASPVDLRGGAHRLWNRDPGGAWGPGTDPLYLGIPVLVGLHPDGDVLSFYENPFEALVRIDADRGVAARAELTFAGGTLRHYVTVGPLPRLLERYSWLTGRPPLPPRWALGYHQCKWGYKSEADVREVSDGFVQEGVPLSAVHLDIDYMDGYRVFTVDRGRFPDLAGLAADLGRRGTRVVTIVDPAVKADEGFELFAQGRDEGRFLADTDGRPLIGVVWPGRAAYPDFTDPATRRWWSGWCTELLDAGVSGFWHDMNEPTSLALWGDRTLPLSTEHRAEGRGGDHRQCHNVYGLLMDQAGFEAQAAQRPGRRPWLLSRSGWAGLQRFAWNWTGDVESSWEGLRQQVATTIGLGLSGVPYTGSDTGGFSGAPGPELFLRWLELSVLMPFCRTHSVTGVPNREPWRWPDPYRSAVDRLICLRYRLLPYLYTLADEASRTGHPFVRPLAWPDGAQAGGRGSSADRRLWQVDDAYLLGDALLVAPATREGERSRPVPLPAGDWYRWRAVAAMAPEGEPPTVERLEGNRTVVLDTPAGQPVVLVRAGTVLPLDDGWADGAEWGDDAGLLSPGHEPRRLAVHCFPTAGGRAAGGCFDDAGDGYGPGRVDRFTLGPGPDGPVLRWGRDGAYHPPGRLTVVAHGLAAAGAVADGVDLAVSVSREPGGAVSTAADCGPFAELRFAL
jgi:alpha-glucosidase